MCYQDENRAHVLVPQIYMKQRILVFIDQSNKVDNAGVMMLICTTGESA
jgi:hypothetical protein